MHYTAMLCHRGLGHDDLRNAKEQLFTRFKAEASQAITGTRRMINPEDNNERQQIHEHEACRSAPSPPTTRSPCA